jgi:hypothetical protein
MTFSPIGFKGYPNPWLPGHVEQHWRQLPWSCQQGFEHHAEPELVMQATFIKAYWFLALIGWSRWLGMGQMVCRYIFRMFSILAGPESVPSRWLLGSPSRANRVGCNRSSRHPTRPTAAPLNGLVPGESAQPWTAVAPNQNANFFPVQSCPKASRQCRHLPMLNLWATFPESWLLVTALIFTFCLFV